MLSLPREIPERTAFIQPVVRIWLLPELLELEASLHSGDPSDGNPA